LGLLLETEILGDDASVVSMSWGSGDDSSSRRCRVFSAGLSRRSVGIGMVVGICSRMILYLVNECCKFPRGRAGMGILIGILKNGETVGTGLLHRGRSLNSRLEQLGTQGLNELVKPGINDLVSIIVHRDQNTAKRSWIDLWSVFQVDRGGFDSMFQSC